MQRLIANICGLWSSQKGEDTSSCWSSSWGRMHKIQREIEGCRITSTGRDGSAHVTFQKRRKGSKKEYKKQLAGTKDDFMALQNIITAIKSALSFLEETEGKEREKSLDCREECRGEQPSLRTAMAQLGICCRGMGAQVKLVRQKPGVWIGGENQLGKELWS